LTNLDGVLWAISRTTAARGHYSLTMATKYYTHFVTARAKAQNAAAVAAASANANEWSGVVELRHPLEHAGGTKELRALLAQSFDLESEDIKILHWARLH
jgi:hypothetical protein